MISSDEDEYELDRAMQAHGSCYYWDEKHECFWRRGIGQYEGGYKESHNEMIEATR